MIAVRRTEPTDYTTLPWRAEIDLSGSMAARFMPLHGPGNAKVCTVHSFGNTPDHAINECYLAVGKRAVLTVEPEQAEATDK